MPRIYTILVSLVFCVSIYSQEAKINAELKQADRLTGTQDYDQALDHINKALKIDPFYIEALEKKANVMILTDRDKDLMKEVNSLISSSPQQPEYYYLRAILYIYKQKPQKAITDLDNAIYYNMPQKYMEKVYLNKGIANYNYGDFADAEQDFTEVIKLNPRNASAYHSWGMLKYEEQSYEEAIKYLNKTVQYQENNSVAYYNLGMAHYKAGDKKDACYNFNKSCTLSNRNACKIYILECTE